MCSRCSTTGVDELSKGKAGPLDQWKFSCWFLFATAVLTYSASGLVSMPGRRLISQKSSAGQWRGGLQTLNAHWQMPGPVEGLLQSPCACVHICVKHANPFYVLTINM